MSDQDIDIHSSNASIEATQQTPVNTNEIKLNIALGGISKKLNKIVLYERPDKEALDKLINSDLLQTTFNCKINKKLYDNERQQLKAYRKLINKDGLVPVSYKKCFEFKYGRVFPSKSLGAVGIRRELRGTLFNKNMVDLDIENCHPVLSYQICEANGIKNKYLEQYVLNRPDLLELIKKEYNDDRDAAKTLFIMLLYFGSFQTWSSKCNVDIHGKKEIEFLTKFKKELSTIGDVIIKNNSELKKANEKHKRKNNKDIPDFKIRSSTVSIYFQEIENAILEEIYFYCIEHKYITECCSLCYDGLMIEKENYKPELLDELNILIKNKFGFDLKFTEKQMVFYDNLDDHIIECIDDDIKASDAVYSKLKTEFELHNFKILDPISFATIRDNGTLILRSRADFVTVNENITYLGKNKNGGDEEKQFIKKWLLDGTNRTYNKIDFLPMQVAPDDVYNTFNGYEAARKELFDVDIDNSLTIKHIRNLCNNEEDAFQYTFKTLARKLQQPHNLTNTALIFKSKEGAGKDLLFNYIGNKIIGSEYYCNTDKPELLFGKFNSCIENKILLIMNETSGKDTYQINENIKCAITAVTNTIEHKGMKPYKNTNHIEYIFLTNNDNPIKVSQGDRRFCGIECNNDICNDKEYFDALRNEMDCGRYDKAFYNYLLNIDVINYDFTNKRPVTKFYNDMKELNTPTIALFLESIVMNQPDNYKIQSSLLFKQYTEFIATFHFKTQPTLTNFIITIKKIDGIEQKRNMIARFIHFDVMKLREYLVTTYNIDFTVTDDDFLDDLSTVNPLDR